ncbi:PREDICTED: seminal plasma protein BSP-30 kDa-like [Galeopterus variegatus]|uniref:Seminal plasma protein BSP-30 kDa-like n=1 Tax=Galeopterus variegatus TaxID=482537 RepID=A0ABM0PYV1_GALVR|nr:PREDICTED: seminal plasma protein BSP-30 kDa-like [Galeopterus variegatus]
MRNLAGWVPLAVCLYGLRAELISHFHLPDQDIPSIPCIFPFTYGNAVHYSCISMHSDFDWCSLDSKFQGRWRYCTGMDPPQCVFPFLYGKKFVYGCTKEGYILNRSWCSLTKNYNKDGKWKRCSPKE